MRRGALWLLPLLVMGLSGCLDASEIFGQDPDKAPCTKEPVSRTYWLNDDWSLTPEFPTRAGSTPGNSAVEGLLVDQADEWLAEPNPLGHRILGDLQLELWVEHTGNPSLFPDTGNVDPTDPTGTQPPNPEDALQFYIQFGTDRGFVDASIFIADDVAQTPGTVSRYEASLAMPEGGYVVERRDTLRLLLTSLVAESGQGGSHHILWGGDTPSRITFSSVCYIDRTWATLTVEPTEIRLEGHEGLWLADVPHEEGFNVQTVPFTLRPETERLTIELVQGADGNPFKDDMDLQILNAQGDDVWFIGSPYADETATRWKANLDALMPPGEYTVKVHSYSGYQYAGTLTVTQEQALK